MNTKNFAIGVLSTTAVILLVGLIVIQTRPDIALASGMTASGGDYVLTVGSSTIGDEELVYVIDGPTEKLVIYRFQANRKEIDLVQRIDLADMRKAAAPTDQPAGQRKPGRSRRP